MFHHACVPPRLIFPGLTRPTFRAAFRLAFRAVNATLAVVLGATLCASPLARAQNFIPPPASNIASVQDFGAIASDGGDDTAAFQAALNALVNTGRTLYVPDGVYNFSDRLNWGGIGLGGFFTMQGQSKAGTILRLNASAAGFDNTNSPKAFIDAYEGNTANQFRTYLRDLTIEVGANNPGAIGLEFQSNNTGRIENVTIRSLDPDRRGKTGLNQGFEFPGPLLIRSVTIEGFDIGYVGAPQEYSAVFENLTLRNQRELGIYVWRLPLQIRNLVSENSVPVLRSDSNPGASGHVVIDGATIGPGLAAPGPTTDAIINSNSAGVLILRNITTSGYRNAVRDESFSTTTPMTVPNGFVAQFLTDAPATIDASPTAILNLPVEDAPAAPAIPVSQWVSVKFFGAIENDNLDDTAAVQAAMNSGAPVIYFPSGNYYLSNTITIGPAVQRVEGLSGDITLNAPLASENRPVWLIPPGSQAEVHLNGLNSSFSGPGQPGGGVWIEQATANTLVVRDGDISYRNTVSGGKLFLENVVGTNMTFTGQKVWARQLNPEGSGGTHIINDGGDLYILGLKTEGSSRTLDNRRGARTTIMGGLIYPATAIADRTQPMITNNESSVSFSLPESAYGDPNNAHAIWVRQTRDGITTDFTRAMLPLGRIHSNFGGQIALYNGYIVDATAPTVPGTPTLLGNSFNQVTIGWTPSTDSQSGIARYNIYRNGIFVRAVMPSAVLTLSDLGLADGADVAYRISAVNGAGIESAQSDPLSTLTLTDTDPPRLLAARTGLDPRLVTLMFSEPLAAAPALVLANYTITSPAPLAAPVAVTAAALSADGLTVTLTTAPMSPGVHRLDLTGLADRATVANVKTAPVRTAFAYTNASNPVGTGLTGQYYNGRDFIGAPILTRIDPVIDFNYGGGSPASGVVPVDNFCISWSGRLQPRFSEPYTLFVRSDDGTRLLIDGVLVVSNWNDQGATERSATVILDSSRTHDIVVQYYENSGGAEVQLSWQSASQPKQVIPAQYLLPDARLVAVRTFNGAGADMELNRVFPSDGTGIAMAAFHSPASGAFHQAAYWRFDLASLDLVNNYATDAVATLSQTFFGIGDGRRLINVFGVRQALGADNWIESGQGFATWQTAPGNNDFGQLGNPVTSQFISTFLLNNVNFNLNNQPDKTTFAGQRLVDFINQDTDGRVTFLAKRVDASNDGQSWFTKEWNQPVFAPAIKVELTPRCPQILTQPVAPALVAGQTVSIFVAVRGAPGLTSQWFRDGQPVSNGPEGASADGGTVAGAYGVVIGGIATLTITDAQVSDAGSYTVTVSGGAACPVASSGAAPLDIAAAACSLADLVGGDGNPPADGSADGNDFVAFLNAFGAGSALGDIVGGDGNPPADGSVDGNDFQAFLNAFAAGC